jgi:hypothetical protein
VEVLVGEVADHLDQDHLVGLVHLDLQEEIHLDPQEHFQMGDLLDLCQLVVLQMDSNIELDMEFPERRLQ